MEAIDRLIKLVEKHRFSYERDDTKVQAVGDAANKERRALSKEKTDEQKTIDDYLASLDNISSMIAEVALLQAKRFDRKLDYAASARVKVPNPMGEFIFVSELISGETDVEYCRKVFENVFNKPRLQQLLGGIQHETDLTTGDIVGMVKGDKPAVATCYSDIKNRLQVEVDCISERRKITNGAIGIDAEPSAGLYGSLYFDLLAEDDSKVGVYIIDQPED